MGTGVLQYQSAVRRNTRAQRVGGGPPSNKGNGFAKFTEAEMENAEDSKIGHRVSIKSWIQNIMGLYAHQTEFDDITRIFLWGKKYIIDTFSYSGLNDRKGIPIADSDICMYTDGSHHTKLIRNENNVIYRLILRF